MPPAMPRKPSLWLSVAFVGVTNLSTDETVSMASSNSDNADRVDPGSLPSGMRSFAHLWKYFAEVEYESGVLSVNHSWLQTQPRIYFRDQSPRKQINPHFYT